MIAHRRDNLAGLGDHVVERDPLPRLDLLAVDGQLDGRGLDVRAALGADVYFDTATYGRRALELCLATFGVGRIVYGSDAPVMDSRTMLRELRTFGGAVVAAVCDENPTYLIG